MTSRAEVAKKLRGVNKENCGWFLTSDTAIYEIGKVIGAQGKPYEFFFNRLADLIDPTCHAIVELEPDGVGAPHRYTSRCSNCGQVWGEAIYFPQVPVYCPVCGARVVCDE